MRVLESLHSALVPTGVSFRLGSQDRKGDGAEAQNVSEQPVGEFVGQDCNDSTRVRIESQFFLWNLLEWCRVVILVLIWLQSAKSSLIDLAEIQMNQSAADADLLFATSQSESNQRSQFTRLSSSCLFIKSLFYRGTFPVMAWLKFCILIMDEWGNRSDVSQYICMKYALTLILICKHSETSKYNFRFIHKLLLSMN